MPVEFISATHITPAPSAHGHNLAGFDPDYTRRFARMLDDGGFDWTLIAYFSGAPDSLQLAQFVAENTERVAPVVAHRPGFTFPTQFAKGIAGLDRISDGRVMIHIISGGSDAEQRREGDYTNKEQRYRRSEELVDVLRRVWTADGPIDHKGEFYEFEDFQTDVKPLRGTVPISVGGSSRPTRSRGRRPPPSSRASRPPRPPPRTAPPTTRPPGSSARPRPTSDRCASRPSPSAGSCTTAACGRRWPGRSRARARRPRWSAPTRPSPRHSSTTPRSAATCCRSAAGTSSRTPRTTGATSCRSCARSWPTAPPPAARRCSTPTPSPPPSPRSPDPTKDPNTVMPVEFISATHISDDHRKVGQGFTGFDPAYTRRFVHALDDAGFDWTLCAYGSPSPDSLQLGQFVANNSEHVKPMIAHRPGFQFPTQVAKAFAGLERISGGRVGIHIISGGADVEQRREGDYTNKVQRYARSDEFVQILRRVWYEDGPLSFEGEYYRFEDFHTDIKPVHGEIPVSVGGSSAEAYDVGGRLGDIFGLWGEPLAETAEQIAAVNAVADAAGRPRPRIWNSFRPIVAPTDALAWEKAHAILAQTQAALKAAPDALKRWNGQDPQNAGSVRLREVAERGDVHDRCLWTPLAKELKGAGSTTALVGSYETVAAALVDYTEIGCDLLSIRGWDVFNDMVDYGRYVVPLVRQELAHREATGTAPVLNPDSRPEVAA